MYVCIYTHLLETLESVRMLYQSKRSPKLKLWWKATWARAPSCTWCAPCKVLLVLVGTVPETAPDSIAPAAQPAHVAHLDSRCVHQSYPSPRCAWWRIALWSWTAQRRWANVVAAPCQHRSAPVQRKPVAALWDIHLCLFEKFINKHNSSMFDFRICQTHPHRAYADSARKYKRSRGCRKLRHRQWRSAPADQLLSYSNESPGTL